MRTQNVRFRIRSCKQLGIARLSFRSTAWSNFHLTVCARSLCGRHLEMVSAPFLAALFRRCRTKTHRLVAVADLAHTVRWKLLHAVLRKESRAMPKVVYKSESEPYVLSSHMSHPDQRNSC